MLGPSRTRVVAAFVCMTLGAGVLLGWLLDIELLKTAGVVPMNPLVAVAFVLSGLSLLAPPRAGVALGILVMAIGALKLPAYLWGLEVGHDQWLFTDALMFAGRRTQLAPNTAFCFSLTGLSLALLRSNSAMLRKLGRGASVLTQAIAVFVVYGYVFNARQLYDVLAVFPMPPHTAAGFIVIGVGVLMARPQEGGASRMLAQDSGGRMLRRLLPVAMLAPLLLGYLRLQAERYQLIPLELGFALMASLTAVIFVAGVMVQARVLSKSEGELRAARIRAEAAARTKTDFVANVSHEIRTPMNAVIGMTSLLREMKLDDRQRDYIETIRMSGEHLLGIINEILDFSKIEAGHLQLDSHAFSLEQVAEEAIDLVAPAATAKALDLLYECKPGAALELRGDAGRLRQVIVNLLSNAVKFTDSGEVLLHVDAKRHENLATVRISVSDTGIGISPDQQAKLFSAFTQADASTTRRFGGTGLGLMISKRLVELMGGSLSLTSALHKGTVFTFDLHAEVLGEATRFSAPELIGRKVLVVDDNTTNLRLLKAHCESWQMRAVTTTSPKDASALFLEDIELVMLDHHMPHVDGVMLAFELQKIRRVPMVLLSSSGRTVSVPEGLFDAVLSKPVKHGALYSTLHALLVTKPERAKTIEQPRREAPSLRILLADDNVANQKVAMRMLEHLGYRCDLVADGQEALESTERQPYDVVFLDLQMPVMDGLEAARRIRLRHTKKPWMIAMTASALADDRDACRNVGMNDFIAKPISLATLKAALERVPLDKVSE
jgi:signal transduction histidine kinase/CheY-like chemotaxis protein